MAAGLIAVVTAVAVVTGVAVVPAGTSPASARGSRDDALVERAARAPFTDVGIPPVEQALEFWRARVDVRPDDTLSRTRLATTLMASARESGDLSLYPQAEAELRSVLAIGPDDEAALLALAGARAADHDFATSIALAERVLARDPSSDAARAVIADGNFELGNYDVAARQLEELAARAGVNEAILSRRAKLAAIRGQNARAVRLAAHALLRAARLDLRPSEAAFYRFQLATFLSQAGNQAGALRAVRAGLGIDPDHVPSQELEARLLVSLGRLRPAARRYESLVARTPAADLHGLLARVYEALGKDGAARREIARGLELGYDALGRYPAERRHLASFFAEFDPPIAVEAALADFATRQDVGAYDALAWAYHRSGDVDNAARYVDGALAQGTRSAPLLAHAGLIEHAVGHERRARALLTEALALDPNFDLVHAPIARRTLESLRGAGS